MSSSSEQQDELPVFEDLRRYFSQKEWSELSESDKLRYAKLKVNYLFGLAKGHKPQPPDFMRSGNTTPLPGLSSSSEEEEEKEEDDEEEEEEEEDQRTPSVSGHKSQPPDFSGNKGSPGLCSSSEEEEEKEEEDDEEEEEEEEQRTTSESGDTQDLASGSEEQEEDSLDWYDALEGPSPPDTGYTAPPSSSSPSGDDKLEDPEWTPSSVPGQGPRSQQKPRSKRTDQTQSQALKTRGAKTHQRAVQRFPCEQCGKSFGRSADRKVHLRTHAGEKPFRCAYCGARFTVAGTLTTHERIHTGEKPFGCTVCDQRFACSGDRGKHLLVHTGVKPYSCEECPKGFNRLGNLQRHHRTHHAGEKP